MKDDNQLIDEVLGGNRSAFGELVRRHHARLRGTLASAMGNRADAEDVAQDAFFQAYLKLDRFNRASAFYTWLYRIAFNLAGTHVRKNRSAVSLHTGLDSSMDPATDSDSPPDLFQRNETRRLVREALDQLTGEHRRILELRDLEGREYGVVAEKLKIPIGTVRSRLFRARAKMREQVQGVLCDSGRTAYW